MTAPTHPTYPPVTLYVVIDKRTGEPVGGAESSREEAIRLADDELFQLLHDREPYKRFRDDLLHNTEKHYSIRRVEYVAKEGQ